MYLSRLILNHSRMALLWIANPYRIHQRLMTGCDHDPRLLFRIEETEDGTQALVQSVNLPNWSMAFSDFPVLLKPPEQKPFNPILHHGRSYRFRLLANPTVKKTVEKEGEEKKARLGLFKEVDQIAWLKRKLEAAGAEVQDCMIVPRGKQYSRKSPAKDEKVQVHLAVLFEGVLLVKDSEALYSALKAGIGPAKGYGFGLLSLAPA